VRRSFFFGAPGMGIDLVVETIYSPEEWASTIVELTTPAV
jgi:hypothetical protein